MRKKIALLTLILVFSAEFVLAQGGPQSTSLGLAPHSPPFGKPSVNSPPPCESTVMPHFPRYNISFFLGGATTPGNATITLTNTGTALFSQLTQKMDVDVSGIMIGMSLGCVINDRLGCRIEAFDLVPSLAKGQITTTLQTGGPVIQQADSPFRFDGVRGEGTVRLWRELAFVGGLYYESLDLRLVKVHSVTSTLVTTTNEGKAEFHTFSVYGGAEYTLSLPFSSYLVARAIGCPWIHCHWDYSVPFQNPASPLFPVLDSGAGNINNGSFGEILVRGAFGIGFAELGAFAKLSTVTLANTVGINSQDVSSGITLQQPFYMSFTRRTVEGGGFVNITF